MKITKRKENLKNRKKNVRVPPGPQALPSVDRAERGVSAKSKE